MSTTSTPLTGKQGNLSQRKQSFKQRMSFRKLPLLMRIKLKQWGLNAKHEALVHEVQHYQDIVNRKRGHGRFILQAQGRFMHNWDNVIIFLCAFTAIMTPFQIAFMDGLTSTVLLTVLNRLVDLGFFVDIFVQFSISYVDDEGILVQQRRAIAERYLWSYFWIDLLSVVPIQLLDYKNRLFKGSLAGRLISLLRMVKLMRLMRLVRIVDRVRSRLIVSNATFSLFCSLGGVLVTIHWIACIWRVVPVVEASAGMWNWAEQNHFEQNALFEQYVLCFEFAMMAMVMGYNEVEPVTGIERTVATIVMVVCGGMYAYMIGAICSIISNMDPATVEFTQRADMLRDFSDKINAPMQMRHELLEYHAQCAAVFPYRFFRDTLEDLSPKWQGVIAGHAYRNILKTIDFFKTPDSDEYHRFTRAVALRIEPCVFACKEFVYMQGDEASTFYVIQRGMATVAGKIVYRRAYFGVDAMMLRTEAPRYDETTFSMSFLHCFCLKREDLVSILDSGTFKGITSSIRQFGRARSLRTFVKHVCVLSRLVRANDSPDDAQDHKMAMSKYREKCMEYSTVKLAKRVKSVKPVADSNADMDDWQRVKKRREQEVWNKIREADTAGLVNVKGAFKDIEGGDLQKIVDSAREKLAELTIRKPTMTTFATMRHAKSKLLKSIKHHNEMCSVPEHAEHAVEPEHVAQQRGEFPRDSSAKKMLGPAVLLSTGTDAWNSECGVIEGKCGEKSPRPTKSKFKGNT